ncbi:MAG: response regulator [Phycisphaera sp.]|nr:MAG: response regulator [Phycisphaera sp.]
MAITVPKSILLVDNDRGVLAALTARLGGMGYRCESACSGAQALSLFKLHGADLIISDLNMPQGDGETLAENIRRVSDVPMIIISGFKDAPRKKLVGIPGVRFLEKPFEGSVLAELVGATLAEPVAEQGDVRRPA